MLSPRASGIKKIDLSTHISGLQYFEQIAEMYSANMSDAGINLPHQSISDDQLNRKIDELLSCFYKKRLDSLQGLRLRAKLQAKNPYLVCAMGIAEAEQIVDELIDAHISSSAETMFGNDFFEPLSKWVAGEALRGLEGVSVQKSTGQGCDIHIETGEWDMAIAVKSGTKVFNAQSRAKQEADFDAIRRRLKTKRKHFSALIGYCYGRKKQRAGAKTMELAGQDFWAELSGDDNFYTRIIHAVAKVSAVHRPEFEKEYLETKRRFVQDFLISYSNDGLIGWEKLAQLSSGRHRSGR